MAEELPIIRGSDHSLLVTWRDTNGDLVDMTNRELSFFDVSPKLEGRVTGEIKAPATGGQLSVRIEGNPPLPVGLYSFRMMLTTPSGDSVSTKRIYVRVE